MNVQMVQKYGLLLGILFTQVGMGSLLIKVSHDICDCAS
jgi:hypothetical protein